MSKITALELRCPACDHTWDGEGFASFNAERLPHLLDDILQHTFEQVECPSCRASFQPEHDMLFSWLPRRLWIVMIPPDGLLDFQRLEQDVARTFREVIATTPGEFMPLVDQLQPQLVFGQRQLAEAVRANQHNLPPALLECAKLALLRDHLAELLPLGPLYLTYEGLEAPGHTLRFAARRLQDGAQLGELRAERALMAQLAAQEDTLRERYPELFALPFANALRYLLAAPPSPQPTP